MISLLENLDTDWEMTVLPQPKAPGMATVPPWTLGKRASSTRWPDNEGLCRRRASRPTDEAHGRARSASCRTRSSCRRTRPRGSSHRRCSCPWQAILVMVPRARGGNRILWTVMKEFSIDGTPDVTARDVVANLHGGREVPLLLAVKGGCGDAAGDVDALGHLRDLLEGTLNTIVDIVEQTGSELDG